MRTCCWVPRHSATTPWNCADAVPVQASWRPVSRAIMTPTCPSMSAEMRAMSPAAAAKVNIVNVDFFAATTYTFLGIPADLGTSIFSVGRIAGWAAHIMEQHGDNRLIRPESEYTGPTGKRFIPIAER